jgi:hypothetical protein
LRSKPYSELLAVIAGAQTAGIQIPGLEEFMSGVRANMDAATREQFLAYLQSL